MKKIPTLFVRDPQDMRRVTREVTPGAEWVLAGEGWPTGKWDGTNICVTVDGGKLVMVEKRRNPTRAEKEAGAEPGYVQAEPANPSDKHIFAAVNATDFSTWPDGSWPCEAMGPKIQGGADGLDPCLISFSLPDWRSWPDSAGDPRTFDDLKTFLEHWSREGIVWHHPDGRMAKIKRRDFGYRWPLAQAPKDDSAPILDGSPRTVDSPGPTGPTEAAPKETP